MPAARGDDFSDQKVISALEALATRSDCVAVIASPPRSSGSATVISCLRVICSAIAHCAAFLFEHHISRATGTAHGGAHAST